MPKLMVKYVDSGLTISIFCMGIYLASLMHAANKWIPWRLGFEFSRFASANNIVGEMVLLLSTFPDE